MMKIVAVLLFIVVNASFGQVDSTRSRGWHKIGAVVSTFNGHPESVIAFNADRYAALRFRVTDAPIWIERGAVYYENGDVEELLINREMSKDEETRPFSLRRPAQVVTKVSFKFKSMPNYIHRKSHVEVWGLK